MNKFIKSILSTAILFLCVSAQAQFYPVPQSGTFTNVPSIITGGSTSNINAVIHLTKHQGVAILPYFSGTNAANGNLILNFQVSADGSTWSTTPAIATTNAANSSTVVLGYNLLPNTTVDNVQYLRLQTAVSSANSTNTLTISNITWSTWQ